ncbi:unnamed protein product [Notodromas monacha]|uniref:Uncharacterized protein n=1 Tax=Notodromas monacha TaxID=399045 RepID=A0A7R9GAG1_9CRUS|nr:unnamed protein product [Notodromas monacha]CAG0915310.1 unnamed protein product [Notodromas monacha]
MLGECPSKERQAMRGVGISTVGIREYVCAPIFSPFVMTAIADQDYDSSTLVRATGSWLDIGTSISHYVISLSLTLFLLVLHQGCMRLTGFWELKQHAA